jgi:hypothetical protein
MRLDDVPERLTKPDKGRKARFFLVIALLCTTGATAAPPNPGPFDLRACIASAQTAAALAACETQAQADLQQRIQQMTTAIRQRLDAKQRLIFERSVSAWQAFFDSEVALLEMSLGLRPDQLGPKLKPGAVTRLYEQREQQLREHTHNLSLARPAGSENMR